MVVARIVVLLLLAASLVQAQEPLLVQNKLDLTASALSSISLQNVSARVAANINIYGIIPLSFMKGTVGYVSVARLPATLTDGVEAGYQCELQLRYVKLRSSHMMGYLLTGNTINFGSRWGMSGDAGGGIRYAFGPHLYVSLPALFSLYPGGLITAVEPSIVWNGLSLSCRATNVVFQSSPMPETKAYFALGYMVSF